MSSGYGRALKNLLFQLLFTTTIYAPFMLISTRAYLPASPAVFRASAPGVSSEVAFEALVKDRSDIEWTGPEKSGSFSRVQATGAGTVLVPRPNEILVLDDRAALAGRVSVEGHYYSHQASTRDTLIFSSLEGKSLGFSPGGELKWSSSPLPAEKRRGAYTPDLRIFAGRDGSVYLLHGDQTLESFSSEGRRKFAAELPGASGAVVGDAQGGAYLVSGSKLLALGKDGEERWSAPVPEHDDKVFPPEVALSAQGLVSVASGKVLKVFTSEGDLVKDFTAGHPFRALSAHPDGGLVAYSKNEVYRLDDSGELRWKTEVPFVLSSYNVPQFCRGHVVLPIPLGSEKPGFGVLNDRGEVTARLESDLEPQGITPSAVSELGVIAMLTRKGLEGYAPDGDLLWKFPVTPPDQVYTNLKTVDSGHLVFSGSSGGSSYLAAVDLRTGVEAFRAELGPGSSSFAVDGDNTVYYTTPDDRLRAVHLFRDVGEAARWAQARKLDRHRSDPTVTIHQTDSYVIIGDVALTIED